MRHLIKGKKLGRNAAHRKALMKNLSIALLERKTIRTTLVKAKILREHIEPLITRAKTDTVANRRLAFSKLRSPEAVGILFKEVAPKMKERPGGYTRVLKYGFRAGDNAPMAFMQLVGFEASESASGNQ